MKTAETTKTTEKHSKSHKNLFSLLLSFFRVKPRMTDYGIGVERIISVEAETEEEAITKAHDKLQEAPIKSEELKIIDQA